MQRLFYTPPTSEDQVPKWREWITGVFTTRREHGIAYDDVYPSAVAVGTTGSNVPSFTAFTGNLKAYEFVGSAQMKEMNLSFQFPHARKDGTNVNPHLHLYVPANAGAAANVRFGMEYAWSDIGDTGAISTTTVYGDLAIGAGDPIKQNEILSLGEIADPFTEDMSSIFMMRLFRDPTAAADTFTSSVWLMSADIHVQRTWIGSKFLFSRE
jgi:hypothetical protein